MTPMDWTRTNTPMRELTELEKAVNTLRRFQRHRLLREFGENGCVLPGNIEVSQALDLLIETFLPDAATPD